MMIQHGYWAPGRIRSLDQHHNNGLELVLVESGQAEWKVDGDPEWVGPGTLFFTLPWQQHGDSYERRLGLELYYVILPLDQDYQQASDDWLFHPKLNLPVAIQEQDVLRRAVMQLSRHCWPATSDFAWSMRTLYRELQQAQFLGSVQVPLLISSLLIQFVRSTQQPTTATDDGVEERVQQFIRELASRCHESWTLESMAAACGLGRTQCAFHIQRLSGFSPKQLLMHQRIDRARDLLRYTDQAVTGIAFDCGFESSQYFARVFKKICGCDARSFRRAAQ